jgi:hypothetical protein
LKLLLQVLHPHELLMLLLLLLLSLILLSLLLLLMLLLRQQSRFQELLLLYQELLLLLMQLLVCFACIADVVVRVALLQLALIVVDVRLVGPMVVILHDIRTAWSILSQQRCSSLIALLTGTTINLCNLF